MTNETFIGPDGEELQEEVRSMEDKTIDELYNTMYIKEIIQEFYEDETPEKCFNICGHLLIRMAEGGLVPMPLINIVRIAFALDPDSEMEDLFPKGNYPEEFVYVTLDDGTRWLPLFTDREEFKDVVKDNLVKEVPIRDIIEQAFERADIEGVIINPETEHYVLIKEALEFLLDKEEECKSYLKE